MLFIGLCIIAVQFYVMLIVLHVHCMCEYIDSIDFGALSGVVNSHTVEIDIVTIIQPSTATLLMRSCAA